MTLVLLPGLDGTDVFFRPLLRALPSWVRPIVVQYPADTGHDYAGLFTLVSEAVRGVDDFWVLGWSFSGPLALMLAAAEPRRTRGVILSASFVRPPHPMLAWFRFAAVDGVITMVRIARRIPLFLSINGARDARRDKAETWARVSARTLAARARAILRVDARDLLRRCDAPIVYLAASRDAVVPRRNADEIVRQAPSTRVMVIEGPHLAMYTNPHAAAEAICRVLRGTEDTEKRRI
ncbi:MAG TPA: alpha/beta hydrolase [Vicinamibacterales bacterium]|nr:alpha/beta hydrolase [Vicinamibacterales bacterium]